MAYAPVCIDILQPPHYPNSNTRVHSDPSSATYVQVSSLKPTSLMTLDSVGAVDKSDPSGCAPPMLPHAGLLFPLHSRRLFIMTYSRCAVASPTRLA
jgi:hypothetical protein